ncbi:MAG: ABC-F family ATP-binding cassette domain-containing protein [Chloroflexia bacterium]|nr:ABC-F family ATP-binding cassette domain-containing protein [Chloroflexia bacterium]
MLTLSHLSKRYGDNLILDSITVSISRGDRIGLVGTNGSGKTTLLALLAGDIEPDGGAISRTPTMRIGYLRQGFADLPGGTLADLLDIPTSGLLRASRALDAASVALADDSHDAADAASVYDDALDRFEAAGGYEKLDALTALLDRLGLPESDLTRPLATLSGGQKTRAGLAGLLATRPDLLLLDEPTNHLDLDALDWLAGFLTAYDGALLIVSHDRGFLDQIASTIFELDAGTHSLTSYTGNYSDYLTAKQAAKEAQVDAYERQRRDIARVERDIRQTQGAAKGIETGTNNDHWRRIAKKVARTAKVRERKLGRLLDSEERIDKPEQRWGLALAFNEAADGARDVVQLDGVTFRFGDTTILQNLDFHLRHGERVALIGPNGAGKSTLIRILTGELTPDEGTARLGTGVSVGHFAQEQETLDVERTVLAQARAVAAGSETEMRTFLHRFLFGGEMVHRRIADLSYGERARLMLALLVLRGANLLLLDEPLNHLDIDAREQFEEALGQFEGTLLMVLHDRFAIERLATRVVELRCGTLREIDPATIRPRVQTP